MILRYIYWLYHICPLCCVFSCFFFFYSWAMYKVGGAQWRSKEFFSEELRPSLWLREAPVNPAEATLSRALSPNSAPISGGEKHLTNATEATLSCTLSPTPPLCLTKWHQCKLCMRSAGCRRKGEAEDRRVSHLAMPLVGPRKTKSIYLFLIHPWLSELK